MSAGLAESSPVEELTTGIEQLFDTWQILGPTKVSVKESSLSTALPFTVHL